MANILIVEDEEDIRDILKTYLINEGHTVFEAENIKKMNTLIEKSTYDIILLDLFVFLHNFFLLNPLNYILPLISRGEK